MAIHTSFFIGYTFPTTDNIEIESNLKLIEDSAKSILPNQFNKVASGVTDKEYEVVYKVELPIFDNDLEKVSLLRALKEIFYETASLKPYFCPFNQKAADKAREDNAR